METKIYIKNISKNSIESLFNKGNINSNVTIKSYEFKNDEKCKVLVIHSDDIELKEGAVYTLDGFLKRCVSKLDKLKQKLSDLESKLYEERVKTNERYNRMGWGYAMRNVKLTISDKREKNIMQRIEEVIKKIEELEK